MTTVLPPVGLTVLRDRIAGALAAGAVGDALGGSTEGRTPQEIRDRWGGWVTGVVDPYSPTWRSDRAMGSLWKADGHITDDTLMVRLLSQVYIEQQRHLSAFDVAEHLVPKMITQRMWIPELEQDLALAQRVFFTEKHMVMRLHVGHVDPREGGGGNAVNCGAAMYAAPIGLVNAGDPLSAYQEAVDITGAHQRSYGREAAGVMAAAVAAAVTPHATARTVMDAVVTVAKDGTKAAIESVLEAASRHTHWSEAVESGDLRAAVRPYDTVADTYLDPGLAARRPSRVHSIEELPVALGFVLIAAGDVTDSILGGVNYGRDADSTASMAGAIAGALRGHGAVPRDLLAQITEASRTDLLDLAEPLSQAAVRMRRDDIERQDLARAAFSWLIS